MLRVIIIFLMFCFQDGEAKKASKIVNGFNAAPGEFPHQVSMQIYGQHICGGSIIGKYHILTAAHCVLDDNKNLYQDMTVLTGTNDRFGSNSGEIHKVRKIVYHKDYNPKNSWINDIAILTLEDPIVFNRYQKPINLPTRDLSPNTEVMASGWGALNFANPSSAPQILQKLDMHVVSNMECQQLHSNRIYPGQICVFKSSGSGVCVGDSGGPLTRNNQIHGITSWVIPCAVGYPDIYTRVYHYLSWIRQQMKN